MGTVYRKRYLTGGKFELSREGIVNHHCAHGFSNLGEERRLRFELERLRGLVARIIPDSVVDELAEEMGFDKVEEADYERG